LVIRNSMVTEELRIGIESRDLLKKNFLISANFLIKL